MKFLRLFACFGALLAFRPALPGFNGQLVTTGPLTLAIAEIPAVREFDTPQPVAVTLTNAGPAALTVTVELGGQVDDWRAVGSAQQQITVPARGTAQVKFAMACGRNTHSAHYPVRVSGAFETEGGRHRAEAVQIFETDFSAALPATAAAGEAPVTRVPAGGALALTSLKTQRVVWAYRDQPPVRLPVGWTGADATSAANFSRGPMARGGETRPALQMHPPYRPGAGTIFAAYRLQLPATTPIRLEFCNAIRDSTPREGRSDGVTFRVWVGEDQLFERHTDTKTWTPGAADLSAYAGREILLRLESHPGPKYNTSCDASFWGSPVIAVGPAPAMLSPAQREALVTRARQTLSAAPSRGDAGLTFELAGGGRAVLALGPNGLTDGVIGFGAGERQVLFAGLHVAVREHLVGEWPSSVVVRGVETRRDAAGRAQIVHRLRVEDRDVALTATVWAEGPALRLKVECPEPITSLALNAADQRARRVYYGHGYCIEDPEAFRATSGGHNLSTSHVGFEFERGLSLLAASDTPVDHLQVDPARRLYQLQTHPDATLTFVPGERGAFDCAIRYRPYYDKPAAAGVARKAGRFVFDLWGGRYADDAAKLARCFDYGLTNSLVVMHVWQRWGYDYRLPDIFPPLPSLGTLAELQDLGRLCSTRGVLWGLHDNYIDLYPDAEGFSYDAITFTPEGKPRRAWLNEGRAAQSYQFRPDRIRPFLQRNLDLIVPALRPTASFVDVFSSINSFDFYDRQGKFHSKLETQRAWGEAFAALREACGNNAPTISEAGGDHLIGWLDGADAQFMQLSRRAAPFHNVVTARDWERVPWFDAVNHTRFSLHGVGYSDRYQGGRSREEHGIESDDYLSAEVLTGHALMIDLAGIGRGAVRKYWLAQDFIAGVARDEIRDVEFAGGDIHRISVTWNSGARVHVNRGETDWKIAGHVLPPYGYWATCGAIESGIARFGAAIAEQSRAPGRYYGNSRGFSPAAPLAITPQAGRVDYLGGREFRMIVDWDAQRAVRKDCAVFYHFSRPTPGRRALTEFTAGGLPSTPTSQWQGRVVTGGEWTVRIPADMPLGEYEVLVGLNDPKNRGARERLLGDEDGRRRYRIGKLVVAGTVQAGVTGVRLEPPATPYVVSNRGLANEAPVDFGWAKTNGAFRCETAADHIVVTPLPDGADFTLQLRLAAVVGHPVEVRAVEAVDARGAKRAPVEFSVQNGELRFGAVKTDFAYRVSFR